jgi:adenosylcobinamide kinase/adenosylcobinamide-phosphate guanylyltransferase
MEQRVALHRQRREGKGWTTVEEPLQLSQALQSCRESSVVLVDCLTLWINNLLYKAQCQQKSISEDQITELCQQVVNASRLGERTVIFVTNELGMGLIPADKSSRLYRDLVGRCNQTIAALADEVIFLVSGYPLIIKE